MESPWPENQSSSRRRAVEQLVRGQEFASQLRVLLSNSTQNERLTSREDLVVKILDSFTNTLSILSNGDFDELSQIPNNTNLGKSEDSGESIKSTSKLKDRRGCYKRRKGSDSWIRESSTWLDDGHAWRKYGQKVILNAKYPRNYFRCTHKLDQGCQATKQVQRTQEDPPKFRTTYYGHHTCKNPFKDPQHLLEDPDNFNDSSKLLSFDAAANNSPTRQQDSSFFFSSFSSIKQEHKDDDLSGDHPLTHNNYQSSSSDYDHLLSPGNLRTFESPGHVSMLSSDHGDVISGLTISCTASTHSLDMGVMMSPHGGFEDLEFDNF